MSRVGLWAVTALMGAGLAAAAPAKRSVPERDLGEISGFGEATTVPVEGLRFRMVAVPPAMSLRTMFEVEATGPSLRDHPAVRLRIRGPGGSESRSPDECFEAMVHPPPFVECTASQGTGWDDGRPRRLSLAIDNLAGKAVSVKLKIVIMDPLE
jgi:hypothetical protein